MSQSATEINYKDFKSFKMIIEVGMFFSENLSDSDIEQFIQDWYVFYKESKCPNVEEWINMWFTDVGRDTHDYWIDKRGMFLLSINSRC